MIEKIIDQIRFHFRRNEYQYHYWFRKLGKFIWLWIKTGVIVALVAGGMYHAARIGNAQGTDADAIWLTVDIITLITMIAWFLGAGDDY